MPSRVSALIAAACFLVLSPAPVSSQGTGPATVSLSTGAVTFAQRDFVLETPLGPAAVTRRYDRDVSAGIFGPGWRLDLPAELQVVNQTAVLLVRAGGATGFGAGKTPGVFEGPGGARATQRPTGWLVEFGDGVTIRFDKQGRELARSDANGNTIAFSYDANGRLSAVKGIDGQPLTFTYGPGDRVASMSDTGGRRASFRYDAAGRLTSVTDADGWITTYGYDARGRLAQATLPDGQALRLSYDTRDRVTEQSSSGGTALTYTYTGPTTRVSRADGAWNETTHDVRGRPVEARDSGGRVQRWTWDPQGRLTSASFPDGSTKTYGYDAQGRTSRQASGTGDVLGVEYQGATERPVSITFNGVSTKFAYDARGNLISTTSPAGRVATYSYDKAGRAISMTDGEGRTTKFEYDAAGRLIRQVNPDQGVQSWTYDAVGRLTRSTDPSGAAAEYQYDARGLLTAVVAPGGSRTTIEYDALGRRTAETGAGRTFRYAHDNNGRLKRITYPDGTTAAPAFDATGRPSAWTDQLGLVTKKEYDALGRPVKTTLPGGIEATTTYDAAGRLQALGVGAASGSFAYDADGRTIRLKDPSGAETRLAVDAAGHVAERVLPGGGIERRTYDADGLIASVTLPAGDTWRYAYDKNGQLVDVRRPDGTSERRSYDAVGRLSATTFPWGGTATHRYDTRGLLVSSTNARGETTAYGYDAAGRLTRKQAPAETWTYAYDSRGNLAQAANGRLTVRHAYDALSRLIETEYVEWGQSLRFEYDDRGRVAARTGPGGKRTAYTYDLLGRVSAIAEGGATFTFAYDKDGRLLERRAPNRTATTYAYDSIGRTSAITHEDAAGKIVALRRYRYDAVGQIAEVEDEQGRKTALQYDAEGRLSAEDRSTARTTYVYGPAAERSSVRGASGTEPYLHDTMGRLERAGAESFTYDADGNLVSRIGPGGTTRYAYDPGHNLVRVDLPNGKVVTYEYGPFGERLARTEDGVTTHNLLDSNGAVQQLSGDFKTRTSYLFSGPDQAVMMTMPDGSSLTFHEDALGSVIAVTDARGQAVARHALDAFGNPITVVKPEFAGTVRFAGRPLDPATGLYDLRARFYDPRLGRFLSRDPLLGEPARPLTFSTYAYAGNNPVANVDPTGEDFYVNPRGNVWWYPSVHQVGQDPDEVLARVFDHPDRAFYVKRGAPILSGDAANQQSYRNTMRHYGEVIRGWMGEDAAANWMPRYVAAVNQQIDRRNLGQRVPLQYFYPDQPGPLDRAPATSATVPSPAVPSPAAAAPIVDGALASGARSGVPRAASFAQPSFAQRAGEAALAATVGTLAVGTAAAFGEAFDVSTGWQVGARRTLLDEADRLVSNTSSALPWAAAGAALTYAGGALAPSTAAALAPVAAGAGAGLAALGLATTAGNQLGMAHLERAGLAAANARAEAIQREQTQSAPLRRLQADLPEILAGVRGRVGSLAALRGQAQAAFDEIATFETEAANAAAAFRNLESRVDGLLRQADAVIDRVKARREREAAATAWWEALTASSSADGRRLSTALNDLRARACRIPALVPAATAENQQSLVREAARLATEAEQTAARVTQAPGGDADATLDAARAAHKDALVEAETLWQGQGNGRTPLQSRLSLIEARLPVLRQAAVLQADVVGHLARLRYFSESQTELDALREQAEVAVPSVEHAESLRASIKTLLDGVSATQTTMDERVRVARTQIQTHSRIQSERGSATPVLTPEAALAVAREVRDCADRARLAATGAQPAALPADTAPGTPPGGDPVSGGFRDLGGTTTPDKPTAQGTQQGAASGQTGGFTDLGGTTTTDPARGSTTSGGLGGVTGSAFQQTSRIRIGAGQTAAWHIFATGSRLGWAGGLGQYSVGPADASIVEHLQTAGEHAMWANRESYTPTIAWTGWQNMQTTYRGWAGQLQRVPANDVRRRIATDTAGQIPGLSQALDYQTVGTTEARANCDSAYVRLGFYLAYGQQAMLIADEAVRNGDRRASVAPRQDAMSHLQTARSILAGYERVIVASGRCADLRDVGTLLDRLFALNANDVGAQANTATEAWTLANERIAALRGPAGASRAQPTPPPAPPPTPTRPPAVAPPTPSRPASDGGELEGTWFECGKATYWPGYKDRPEDLERVSRCVQEGLGGPASRRMWAGFAVEFTRNGQQYAGRVAGTSQIRVSAREAFWGKAFMYQPAGEVFRLARTAPGTYSGEVFDGQGCVPGECNPQWYPTRLIVDGDIAREYYMRRGRNDTGLVIFWVRVKAR